MNITDEEFAALADGELSGPEADRVAAAVAADPALAARLDAERRLRGVLRGHLDPVLDEPMPESLTLMIAAAAAEQAEQEMIDTPAQPAPVLDFVAARARRDAARKPAPVVRPSARWGIGAAIAASLAIGLFMGTQIDRGDAIRTAPDGALVASGTLARGLDTQLASADGSGNLRILTSFQRSNDGGGYCRIYEAGASAGIACKDGADWVIQRTAASGPREVGAYRQAGSAQGELMAAAQEMAAGEPLDAAQERAARTKGWKP